MNKKLFFIAAAALVLGGCSLVTKPEPAATDAMSPAPSMSSSPTEIDEVRTFEQSQSTSSGTDDNSLENDLNSTILPSDDLSDILE